MNPTNNNEVTITIQVGNGRSVVKTITETEAIALGLVTAKPKVWKPVLGDIAILCVKESHHTYGSNFSEDAYKAGLMFETNCEAKKHYEYLCALKRIKDYCIENFGEFLPDWDNAGEGKHYMYYYNFESKFKPTFVQSCQYLTGLPYLANQSNVEKVIKDCEKDLKIVFGIE